MGQGPKFDSALGTRGGRANFITNNDIASGDALAKDILSEMKEEGIKFSKDKIVFAAKLKNGSKIFLETDAVNHIIQGHATDFENAFGVKSHQIAPLLSDTICKGTLVSSKVSIVNGKTCYSNKYYYKGEYSIVYGIADNGYIETAYPRGGKK